MSNDNGGWLWFNLDNEGKFYRSLWMIPVTFVLLFFPGGALGFFGFLIVLSIGIVQSIVYYHKWQNE